MFENNLVYGSKDADLKVSSTDNAAAISTLIRAKNVFDNSKYASELFVAPYNFGSDFSNTSATPDFKVLSGSAAASGAIFTNAKVSGSFFEKVAYKGAFGTTDWTSGWAHYDPQNLAYTTPGQVK